MADSGTGSAKQGLGCDGSSRPDEPSSDDTCVPGTRRFRWKRAEYQTVVDNVSLLTPELLIRSRLVVESGHKVAKKKPGEPLRGRCDSFVVETDVPYPTDVSLLWDAVRCLAAGDGADG